MMFTKVGAGKIFLVVSLFLLFLASGFAWVYDVEDQEVSLCRGETKSIDFELVNNEDSKVNLNIKKGGRASEWSIMAPRSFELGEGESKTVYIFINPPDSAEPGDYNLKLKIGEREVDYTVHLNYCRSLEFSKVRRKRTCLLEPVSYQFNLSNTGKSDENIELNLRGKGKELVELSSDEFRLNPGETESITTFFYPTKEPGNYTVYLEASSKDSKAKASTAIKSNVRRCSDYELFGPKEARVCEGEYVVKALQLHNTGNREDEYELSASPTWAELSKNKIELEENSAYMFFLNLTPPCGLNEEKEVDINVKAKEALKNLTYSIPVKVKDCYSVGVEFESSQAVICEHETGKFNLSVRNPGKRELDCNLALEGIGDLKDSNISLKPGEKARTWVEVKGKPANYTITSQVVCDEKCKLENQDSFGLEVKSFKGCRKPFLDLKDKYTFNRGELIKINLVVENQGIRKTNYSLLFSGPASSWVSGITDSEFNLKPGESEKSYLILSAPKNASVSSLNLEVYSQDKLVGRRTVKLEPEGLVSTITSKAITELKGQIKFYWALILGLVISLIITWLKILKE